jgi:hypothetical protein
LVNVHIHQFQPGGAVVDAAALAQFQQQWATYGKLVASDCLSQREVSGILHVTLNEIFKQPFSFLDIACGDASMMKAALAGTKSATITASISHNRRSSLPPATSRPCPARSISTTAISWMP